MTDRQMRGRRLLMAIIAGTVALSLALLAVQSYAGSLKPSSIIRTGIQVALLYQLWRGVRWARWLMTFLYAIGGTYGVLLALRLGLPAAIPLAMTGVLYYTFALFLAWSQDLHAFLLAKSKKEPKQSFDTDFA